MSNFISLIVIIFFHNFEASLGNVQIPDQCPPSQDHKCFSAITDQQLNWNDAEAYCEANFPSGRLASIRNAFEGGTINTWLPNMTNNPWIGAFRVGSLPFQWSDGSPFDYTNWSQGQPIKNCGQICRTSGTTAGDPCQQGRWGTADCENTKSQFICEYFSSSSSSSTVAPSSPPSDHYCDSTTGKCFKLVTDSMEWSEAERYCQNQSVSQNMTITTLASVISQSDANIISQLLQYPALTKNIWIGGYAFAGSPFSWTDQNSFSYTNWAPGQPPSNADGCVQVCLKNDTNCIQGKWTVLPCSVQQSFVCEYQQITVGDCLELQQKYPGASSGAYLLSPPHIQPFYAFCDMTTDGGGWTVFHRRFNEYLSFYDKTWNEYKNGFHDNDDLSSNLWLGNDRIHALTAKDLNVQLRIDIRYDRNPNGNLPTGQWYQKYTSFLVDHESNNYMLHLYYSSDGNATNGASYDSGMNNNRGYTFSTIDVDNTTANCAKGAGNLGGWWFNSQSGNNCGYASLNGKYNPTQYGEFEGIYWCYEAPTCMNPTQSSMMLRKIA
uniref:Uncharacterized protein n=1 Tax=Plectus sambesii TaxID=2011161 RepID=A0A914UVV9_9BILA